jgi:hypothetical protein
LTFPSRKKMKTRGSRFVQGVLFAIKMFLRRDIVVAFFV